MPDSYKDLTHSAAEIDAAVGKANTAVQPGDIGTAAAQDVEYFATAAQGTKADSAIQPEDLGTAALADATDFATAAQGTKADSAIQPGDIGTAAAQDVDYFATAAQGGKADSAIQGLKVNSSTVTPDSDKILSITIPTSASDINALPNTTKYAAAIDVSINSSTYVMAVQLKDQNGDNIGSSDSIDLPLETMVVGGSYDSTNKKVVLTLKNGETVEFSVADLVSGLQTELSANNKLNPAYINYDGAHRAVSDTEKTTWNGKQSALSSTQLDAVNSGIDSTKVDQIATNENNISINTNYGVKNRAAPATVVSPSPDITVVQDGEGHYEISGDSGGVQRTIRIYNPSTPLECTEEMFVVPANTSENTTYACYWTLNDNDNYTTIPAQGLTIPIGAKINRLYIQVQANKIFDFVVNLMVCPKSLYDADPSHQPYALSNVELTDLSAEDRAALVELVDGGAKNCLPIPSGLSGTLVDKASIATDGTITITLEAALTSEGGVNWEFPLSAGTVHFSCGENSSVSGQYDCYIGNTATTPPTTVLRDNSTSPGQVATIESGNYRCTIRMRANTPAGTYTFKPMICTKAAWDISQTYQPYRPSYQELYERVETNKNNISSVQEQANWNSNYGVKNICPYNSGTTSTGEGTIWNNLPIDIAAGTYSVSFSTDSTNSALVLLAADGATEVLRKTYSTTTVNDTFTISTAAKYIRLYIGAPKTVSNFMIHSFGDDTYQPYAMSNAELTAAIQALQAQLANQ